MGNRHRSRRARGHDSDVSDDTFASIRRERIQKLLFEEISSLLRYEVADPALADARVASVELSLDYKHVRVGYVLLAGADRRAAAAAFERAAGFFRARIRDLVAWKRLPDASFLCIGDGVLRARS